jgi:hypothetical protein
LSGARKAWVIGGAAAALAVLVELALGHPHFETFWHRLPGFDLVSGAVGCAAIVVLSKALGKAFVQKDERFYGEDE